MTIFILVLVFCIAVMLGFMKFFWTTYESSLEKKSFSVDVKINNNAEFQQKLKEACGQNTDDLTYYFSLKYSDISQGTYCCIFNTEIPLSLSQREISNVVDLSYIKIAFNKITKANFYLMADFILELASEDEKYFTRFDPKTLYSFLYDYIYKIEFSENEQRLKITRDTWEGSGIRSRDHSRNFMWMPKTFGTNIEAARKNAVLGFFFSLWPWIFCNYATFKLDFLDQNLPLSLKIFLISGDLALPILIVFIIYSSIQISKYKKLLDRLFLNFISRKVCTIVR